MYSVRLGRATKSVLAISFVVWIAHQNSKHPKPDAQSNYGKHCTMILLGPNVAEEQGDVLQSLLNTINQRKPRSPKAVVAFDPSFWNTYRINPVLAPQKRDVEYTEIIWEVLQRRLSQQEFFFNPNGRKNATTPPIGDRKTLMTSGLGWLSDKLKGFTDNVICSHWDFLFVPSSTDLEKGADDFSSVANMIKNFNARYNSFFIIANDKTDTQKALADNLDLAATIRDSLNLLHVSTKELDGLLAVKKHLFMLDISRSTKLTSGDGDIGRVLNDEVFGIFLMKVPYLPSHKLDIMIFGEETVKIGGTVSLDDVPFVRHVSARQLAKANPSFTDIVSMLNFLKDKPDYRSVWVYSDGIHDSRSDGKVNDWLDKSCESDLSKESSDEQEDLRWLYLQIPRGVTQDSSGVKEFERAAECLGFKYSLIETDRYEVEENSVKKPQ